MRTSGVFSATSTILSEDSETHEPQVINAPKGCSSMFELCELSTLALQPFQTAQGQLKRVIPSLNQKPNFSFCLCDMR